MPYLLICVLTVGISTLAFLSGFGLGTLLLPVFLWFFPPPVAIAATAVVHLFSNLLKGALIGKHAQWSVLARFALPATLFAMLGAFMLNQVTQLPPLWQAQAFDQTLVVSPVKLLIAFLMAGFALLDLLPSFQNLAFSAKWLPLGGAVAGFFGGLTGHQGALRSAFLLRLGLEKEAFAGTSAVSAIIIDVSRLIVYGFTIFTPHAQTLASLETWPLLGAGLISALAGNLLGQHFLKKITLKTVHSIVGILLLVYATGLAIGLI